MPTGPTPCRGCGGGFFEPRYGALFCCDCDLQWQPAGPLAQAPELDE